MIFRSFSRGREHVSSNILNEKQKRHINTSFCQKLFCLKVFKSYNSHALYFVSVSFSHQIKHSFLHVSNIKTLRIRGVSIIMSVAAPAGIISPCHDVFLNVCVRICLKRQKERERKKRHTHFPKTGSKVQGM